MLKNNNQTMVDTISKRTMKSNRTRNIVAIIAIILTTFMFTSVFSFGFSLAKNMNTMMARKMGTIGCFGLENPTDEQIKTIENIEGIKAVGEKITVGDAELGKGNILRVFYLDQNEFEVNYSPAISEINGTYPKEKDQVMVSKAGLELLGIKDPKKNMDISITVQKKQENFKLSGWFTGYESGASANQVFVSKAFVDEKGLTVQKDGMLDISTKLFAKSDVAKALLSKVDLKEKQEILGAEYTSEDSIDTYVGVGIAMGIMGLIIVLSGYLLIYNVMYISVTKDIRFFGMIKTIGTSPKQIKHIVKKQAYHLAIIGIPIGVALGTLVSFFVVPYAIQMFHNDGDQALPTAMTFEPGIYIGTVLFAFVTILLSCRKPAKLASRISPVEAEKYTGIKESKIKAKKGGQGQKLYKMAFRNVFREKKRAILVYASLFMGTMAFLSCNAFFGTMKVDNYIDYYLPNDFTIYPNSEKYPDSKLANEIYDQLKQLDGIKTIEKNRGVEVNLDFDKELYAPFLNSKIGAVEEQEAQYKEYETGKTPYTTIVTGVSSRMMKEYNKRAYKKIDIEKFEKGEICLMGPINTNKDTDFLAGKTISMTDTKTGKKMQMEIGSAFNDNQTRGLNVAYNWGALGIPRCILVSQNVIDKLSNDPITSYIIMDIEQNSYDSVKKQIDTLTKNNDVISMVEDKKSEAESTRTSMISMRIITSAIGIILILIGLLNFINVMLTGVYTRRKELAVLESIGMTKKQIKKMLMFEGTYYGIITLVLILTAGNAIVYGVAGLAQKMANYAVFYYPLIPMIIMVIVIFAVCMIVPILVYRVLAKESVTERLRGNE